MSARWLRYGRGTVRMHLRSGQTLDVRVDCFIYRNDPVAGEQWQWTPDGPDTLPRPPEGQDVVAIEHLPAPEESS